MEKLMLEAVHMGAYHVGFKVSGGGMLYCEIWAYGQSDKYLAPVPTFAVQGEKMQSPLDALKSAVGQLKTRHRAMPQASLFDDDETDIWA